MLDLLLVAQLVTVRPGVDCSLLTAQQARGLVCANAPQAEPVPDEPVCDPRPNPYLEPDRATACADAERRRTPPPHAVPAFLIGRIYRFGYDTVRARIVSLGTEDGVQVVTVRWLTEEGDGALSAFRTPAVPGGATMWRLVDTP